MITMELHDHGEGVGASGGGAGAVPVVGRRYGRTVSRTTRCGPAEGGASDMRHAQESDRAQIVEKAIEAAQGQGDADPGLARLTARYLRHVAVEDLVEREPIDLAGAVTSHLQLAGDRPQGTANVRVFTPTVEVNGWSTGHTVVEVVTDDMPFL